MTIIQVNTADDLSLAEYHVGFAKKTCVYPGIDQCFAIAGWTPGGMICSHVSPGSTKQDLKDTFDYLRQLGGQSARYWYVVGPCTDHFKVAAALWKSVLDIEAAFDKAFKGSASRRFILDASQQRATHAWGIDVRAEHREWEGMVRFSYAQKGRIKKTVATNFALKDFKSF